MSSELLSEGDQFSQRSNGDDVNMLTSKCSTPALHGSRALSPSSDALSKDSGISQVFFPSDFEGNSVSGSPLSPVLEDNARIRNATVRGRSRRSCSWIGFILIWIGILLVAVMVHYGSIKIQEYKVVVYDFLAYHGWKCLAYICCAAIALLSILVKICLDRGDSQSLCEVITEQSNSSAEESKPAGNRASVSAAATHRDFQCRRTFSGTGNDTWHDFKKYFGNLAVLNNWSKEQSRMTLLCSLRGQAETFAYGLPVSVQNDWDTLFSRMEQRFGIMNMKANYIADARLRRKKKEESYREFGQAIEDLYRKAYPDNTEIVEEQAIITFLDNCHDSTDFRLAVKRTRPKTVHEAVTSAVQEESLRLTERERSKLDPRSRPIYAMGGASARARFNSRGR
ncbi:MAG: hypothetical protein N0C90_19795, partial [Candidatus Thiodiazotropha endolucinida]|nr:hypothetical protein [Candidatus Thiodiazotropha taylori]MCW4263598.1 hypothetical protein [Candidatus Thiodiazotropha endolucinida]